MDIYFNVLYKHASVGLLVYMVSTYLTLQEIVKQFFSFLHFLEEFIRIAVVSSINVWEKSHGPGVLLLRAFRISIQLFWVFFWRGEGVLEIELRTSSLLGKYSTT
jgi:hypothetical protein